MRRLLVDRRAQIIIISLQLLFIAEAADKPVWLARSLIHVRFHVRFPIRRRRKFFFSSAAEQTIKGRADLKGADLPCRALSQSDLAPMAPSVWNRNGEVAAGDEFIGLYWYRDARGTADSLRGASAMRPREEFFGRKQRRLDERRAIPSLFCPARILMAAASPREEIITRDA
jgi:hypothetical protein